MEIFNVGEKVWVRAREPMPQMMKQALQEPQVIKVAKHPYYEFESGWSVNVAMGDIISEA